MSPTSVAITFEQIKRGSELSISEVFKMEYRLGNLIIFLFQGNSEISIIKHVKMFYD